MVGRRAKALSYPPPPPEVAGGGGGGGVTVNYTCTYTPLSMAYYTYDSTLNFLSLGSIALIHILKERCACSRQVYTT